MASYRVSEKRYHDNVLSEICTELEEYWHHLVSLFGKAIPDRLYHLVPPFANRYDVTIRLWMCTVFETYAYLVQPPIAFRTATPLSHNIMWDVSVVDSSELLVFTQDDDEPQFLHFDTACALMCTADSTHDICNDCIDIHVERCSNGLGCFLSNYQVYDVMCSACGYHKPSPSHCNKCKQ